MTDQPPVQPPNQPPNQPAQQPAQGTPATQPMPATLSPAAPTPPPEPKRNLWRRATSTRRGMWAVGLAAGALATLMVLGIGLAGLAVLRLHDNVSLLGDRQDRFSRGQDRLGPGNGRRPGARDRDQQRPPGGPGGQDRGPGGLGGLLGPTALHGQVTAPVNGTVLALLFQRGEVTAVSATSITLKSTDGFTGTYGLTPATTWRGATAVKGGQAFVLARASDQVTIRGVTLPARAGVGPT